MFTKKAYLGKRIPLVGLILLLVFCFLSIPAFGETMDYSKMDYDSLLALKQEVDLELHSRPEASPKILNPGQYTVGSDIKAGKYNVIFEGPGSSRNCEFALFSDKSAFAASLAAPAGERRNHVLLYGSIRASDRSMVINLQEGNYLITEGASIKLSVTDFDNEDYYSYTAPEGTIVPLGTYTVGKEIPAGSYTAYPYYLEGAEIIIYKNAETLAAEKYMNIHSDADTTIYLGITSDRRSSIFKLDEGNIAIIENAVVMTKNAALFFGD